MDNALDSKDVLFIAPVFYDYHTKIQKALQERGASVTFFPEMEYSVAFRIIGKLFPGYMELLIKRHHAKILTHAKNMAYDKVFVIRGGFFTEEFMGSLKKILPDAEFVLYEWDSLRQNNYRHLLPFFDKVKTFDRPDADSLGISYQPLFYTSEYAELRQVVEERKDGQIDLAFIGAFHSDRLEIVKRFHDLLDREGLVFKSHLFIKRIPLLRMLLSGQIKVSDLKYLSTYSLDKYGVVEIYRQSNTILDIELNIQSGLSIRTIETVGAGLNLITTNPHVTYEPFFDSTRIQVVDRAELDIDIDFFARSKVRYPYKHYDNYSLENWVEQVFN